MSYKIPKITPLDWKNAVHAASFAALTATYANGTAGVGATLANSATLAALVLDGVTISTIGQRVLIKDQGSTFQNGIYTLTTAGTGAVAWVLTRATDYNTISQIGPGNIVPVINGTVQANESWIEASVTPVNIGTDAITFGQFTTAPVSLTQFHVLVAGSNSTISQVSSVGSIGQVLQSGGASANPSYSTATYPSTTTINQIFYSSSTNVVAGLATANNSIVLTDGSGVPSLGTSLSNDFTFTSPTSAATRTLTISNTSNTASSSANVLVSVAGATAADPTHQSVVTGVTTWTWGIDNSVTSPTADPWVLAQGTALGTNNVMSVATSGEINYPLQPAFFAYLNTAVLNVTGDGTEYTIIYDTEVFDQNSDFNLGTSVFTAPVTGRYHIDVSSSLIGGTVMTTVICRITTSNNVFRFTLPTNAGLTSAASAAGSVLCDMDAADTFTITLQSTDTGGKVDDVAGTTGGQLRNWVSAQLSI
jgi:hypothetical protein